MTTITREFHLFAAAMTPRLWLALAAWCVVWLSLAVRFFVIGNRYDRAARQTAEAMERRTDYARYR